MSRPLVVFLFRQDLRLSDNPGLYYAAQQGTVFPLYILNDADSGYPAGGASRWALHQALRALNQELGLKLNLYRGNPVEVFEQLMASLPIQAVYWNRGYDPEQRQQETHLKEWLRKKGIFSESFGASLLWEPWEIMTDQGGPYKVFTSFYKKCLSFPSPRLPFPRPESLDLYKKIEGTLRLEDFNLLPQVRWDRKLIPFWEISEKGAQDALQSFVETKLLHYAEGRDFPALNQVSRLSPHLHFGTLSPHQVWHGVQKKTFSGAGNQSAESFLREVGWREFSFYTLYHFPTLPFQNLNKKFDLFPWAGNGSGFEAWKQGKTGYPFVDAGMRELWQTGTMHNRLRMITGSFLVKNLLQDWRKGAAWFWECLVDADLASNSLNWQWVAGCGIETAPYFRIFNPVLQGKRFDPEGTYTRRFLPELDRLPLTYLFEPWIAPKDVLKKADISLGETYPLPVVEWGPSRARALEGYGSLENKGN